MRNWFIISLSLLLEVRKRSVPHVSHSVSLMEFEKGGDDSEHCEQSPASCVKHDLTFKIKSRNSRAAAAAKALQSCLTLCNPIDGSLPGSPLSGILQARTLEWVAISFSKAWKWKVKGKSLSCVRLFETPWTAAHQAPLSMGFSRQEYWSGLPLSSPERVMVPH